MRPLFIDVETFAAGPDVTKIGVYKYVEDPTFEILCVCWEFEGVKGEWRLWEQPYCPDEFTAAVEAADFAVAFNANFERIVFGSKFAWRLGVPSVLSDIAFWRCAAVRCLAAGLPGKPEPAMQAFKPMHKKHRLGHNAMLKLSKPRRPSQKNPARRWLPSHCPDDYDYLVTYCHQDVTDEIYLWNNTRDIGASEDELYAIDQQINDHGVRINPDEVIALVDVCKQQKEILNAESKMLTGMTLGQVGRIADYIGTDKLDADTVDRVLKDGFVGNRMLSDSQIRTLELRKEFAKTSVSKLDKMLACACQDGRLHGMFQMNGAMATNRWAGRIVQLQNLVRDRVDDPDRILANIKGRPVDDLSREYGGLLTLASKMIRNMLVPEPGNTFVQCDCHTGLGRRLPVLHGRVQRRGHDV
jgi:DNA polymerase